MKIKEVANLVGISVRTLHHYDEIGLLTPKKKNDSGYRIYTEKDLETLQQILFFRELDFSLRQIKEMINSPVFDREEALIMQRKMLQERRRRLDQMIETIDKTIQMRKEKLECRTRKSLRALILPTIPMKKKHVNVGEIKP